MKSISYHYSSISARDETTIDFVPLFINISTWRNHHTPSGVCANNGSCRTLGAVVLVTGSFCCKVEKGYLGKQFERKKEQDKAYHEESAIDSMHILVVLLASIDSMLHLVFAADCKQHTGFFALPVRSSHSRHTLHVTESREPTPSDGTLVRFGSKPQYKMDWLKLVWNRINLNWFKV